MRTGELQGRPGGTVNFNPVLVVRGYLQYLQSSLARSRE